MRSYTTPLKTASVPFNAVGVWRAVVTAVDGAQVTVVVPRLSGDLEYGPLDVLSDTGTIPPAVGDPVVVGFVEGRQDELVVLGTVRTSAAVAETGSGVGAVYVTHSTAAGVVNDVADSVDASAYRSVRWSIQATRPDAPQYTTSELVAVHDGTSVWFNEYGYVSAGDQAPVDYDATISGGQLQLLVSPFDDTDFRILRYAVPV